MRACVRCILSDMDYPAITFDDKGVCSICHQYDEYVNATIVRGDEGKAELNRMIENIRLQGKNKKYDCIIGVSGGLDSTYLVWLAKEWGLRPLLVHVDNGWNSALSVKNIELITRYSGFDLYTFVLDWPEMKDLQLSFLKASVLDIELPFDNVFYAALFKVARMYKLKNILCGYNVVTEGLLPPNFTHYKLDSMNLRAIHRRYGTLRLRKTPLIGIFRNFWFTRMRGYHIVSPLNYIDYAPLEVKDMLVRDIGWTSYGIKHCENIFTRFYQEYILPKKFNIHKRRAHLSTLVCSGQMSREQALEEVKNDDFFDTEQQRTDRYFVIKKMGLTEEEFEKIMMQPVREHTEFPSYINVYQRIRPLLRFSRRVLGKKAQMFLYASYETGKQVTETEEIIGNGLL